MDGGMVSRLEKASFFKYSAKNKFFAEGEIILLRANVRSAVRIFTGEAGETFALL
jgi:hypothetical protein